MRTLWPPAISLGSSLSISTSFPAAWIMACSWKSGASGLWVFRKSSRIFSSAPEKECNKTIPWTNSEGKSCSLLYRSWKKNWSELLDPDQQSVEATRCMHAWSVPSVEGSAVGVGPSCREHKCSAFLGNLTRWRKNWRYEAASFKSRNLHRKATKRHTVDIIKSS